MPRLRVASFNISGAINEDRRFYSKRGTPKTLERARQARDNIVAIAELLQEHQIDIAALQEVDICYSGSETVFQPAFLARQMTAHVEYEPLFDYHLGRRTNVTTGLATVSRPEIRSRSSVRFPQRHVPWKRKLKGKLLGTKHALHTVHRIEGADLHVVNAHLSHDIDAQKEFELALLLDYCRVLDPVVLLADLNTTTPSTRSATMVEGHYFGKDQCMEQLARCLRESGMQVDPRLGDFSEQATTAQAVCTYPSEQPSIKLDYCLAFSKNVDIKISSEQVIDSRISNHRPTSITLDW